MVKLSMVKKIFKYSVMNTNNLTFKLSIILISFYTYQDQTKWQIIKYINSQGPIIYVDSYTVLYYTECFSRIGNQVFSAGVNCANWSYGSGLLNFLNLVGAVKVNTAIWGHFFTYSIVLTFVYFLYLIRGFKLAQVTMFMGLISPPIWLLMERANFDALIYLMIFFAVVLYTKSFEIIPIVVLLLSALFKFYTLPLLIIPILLSKKMYVKVFGMCALFLGTVAIIGDFKIMDGKIIQAGNNHFGMKIIGNYLGKIGISLNIISAYFLGAILLSTTIILVIFILSKREPLLLQRQLQPDLVRIYYIFMASTFLICFIAGLSVDYKLIFYIVSAPFLITMLKTSLRFAASGIFLIGVWLCYPSGIFQTVGDFALEIMAAFQIIILFFLFFTRKISKL